MVRVQCPQEILGIEKVWVSMAVASSDCGFRQVAPSGNPPGKAAGGKPWAPVLKIQA
jgi:hypothetical protein